MLLGLIVTVAIILIVLSVAAAKVAFSLRREREQESARRAKQYVRAIQVYYKKFGRYPGSIEQLENSNGVRYLRKQYVDPLTGKANYRLIAVGQNKTTVTGFFGEPLTGLATGGLGAAAGMQSNGIGDAAQSSGAPGAGGTPGSPAAQGSTGSTNSNSPFGGSFGFGGSSGSGGSPGPGGTPGLGSVAGMGSSGMGGSFGPFMGVGSSATGHSILVVNGQTTYQSWEFLYDPRIELLKLAAALNGGGSGSLSGGTPGQTTNGSNGFGSSGFGSSGFGQSTGGPGQSQPAPSGPSPTTIP